MAGTHRAVGSIALRSRSRPNPSLRPPRPIPSQKSRDAVTACLHALLPAPKRCVERVPMTLRTICTIPYRVTCVVTKLVTEPTASNEQVMEQVMHYLLFGGKSK